MLSDRVQRIGFSPTLRISGKAKQMAAEGIDVVDFSVGEPDFPTPDNIKRAAVRAIEANKTKYTENSGIPELKSAIIRKFKEEYRAEYKPSQVIISSGAKNCLYNLCTALFNKGEECIIPEPYWVSYPHMVELAKGVPVFVHTREEDGFLLTPEDLERAITPNTKAIILNNPSNPTGAAYNEEQLRAVVDTALKEGLVIIADEIYEKLTYDGFRFVSVCALSEKARERSVVVNGFSKAYAMTGWRLGYAVGPEELIAGMDKVQSHSTSNANSITQWAGVEALNGPQYEISRMVSEFQKRRGYMLYRLGMLSGISCFKPQGAFYLYSNFSKYYDMEFENMQIRNSYGMSYYLLKHAHVAVVPGAAFGSDNFIRLSYAASMERIKTAMDRITEAIARLQPARKVKIFALNDTMTKVRNYVETDVNLNFDMRDALIAESDSHLRYDNYYEWNANIAGVVIQLRTNSPHLNDFWMENWYPAQLETELEPHGVIYAVKGVTGRDPRAYYNSDTRTGFIFNTAFYGQLRSMALGMVSDIAERMFDAHFLHGACVDIDGKGTVIIGGPGMGKSGPIFKLLENPGAKLIAYDGVMMRYSAREAITDMPERKIYFKTKFVEKMLKLAPLLDNSKCENVITNKSECANEPCLREDNCRLDRGKPFCYSAFGNSRAMLDPYWIGGTEKHCKRTVLKNIIILRNDQFAPLTEALPAGKAVEIMEQGKTGMFGGGDERFFNPHLLAKTSDRIELQKRFLTRLFSLAKVYYVNIGSSGGKEAMMKAVEEIASE
ncbi:MAG: aminotransferase class I/II-fold pyridoxal phosphate-dependent enzyme [FCB group bacterium]|nr:aminotransferase class I/II-fold pyridoxal phosphate-dependent enzyme [FCB group bacterium]